MSNGNRVVLKINSMFDFIKTPKDMDVKAFQWFIQNTSPLSDRPFLTVDMLWDFFYEKGKDYLSSDIKLILDTFPQQKQLTDIIKCFNIFKYQLICMLVVKNFKAVNPFPFQ